MWYVLDLLVRKFPEGICLFQLYFYTQETSPKQLADIKVQNNRKHWFSEVISNGRNICGLYLVSPKPAFVPLCPLLFNHRSYISESQAYFIFSLLGYGRRYFIKLSRQPTSHPSHPFPIFPATQNFQVFSKHYMLCFFFCVLLRRQD